MSIPPRRPRTIDARSFRDALGRFATGVTVITTQAADGGYVGMTANSFGSVSLDPPLVLWCLDLRSTSLREFLDCSHFAVNVLAQDQVALSRRFSSPLPNRFAGVSFRVGAAGAPLIDGCVAWFECATRTHHPAGDHVILVGEVESCSFVDRPPLLFHASRYGAAGPHPDER